MTVPARRRSLAAAALLAVTASARAGLTADELLLIVNSAVPQSGELAEQYAKLRDVPSARVLRLDLPTGEDMTRDEYESRLAKPVRDYLASPAGQGVRCVVPFYGVPLRVGAVPSVPGDKGESDALKRLLADLDTRSVALAKSMDEAAGLTVAPPVDIPATNVASAKAHIAEVQRRVQAALANAVDPAQQQTVVQAFKAAQEKSIASALESLGATAGDPAPTAALIQNNLNRPHDAAARKEGRRLIAQAAGVFALHQVVEQQLVWLDDAETDAAVDSELALVRLPDFPRGHWQPNPLHYRTPNNDVPAVMVCRLDAPTAQIVAKLLADGLATERAGLDGKVVFDGRGLPLMKNGQPDGYGVFDQAIRDAAAYLRGKTKLDVIADDREALIPPREVPGTALYCGWYSLRRYVPSCGFVRGAVGYHVASFELVVLHSMQEKGWVANLLKEGVVATLGPVSEPYLASFPRPDEFLPLLLTGRSTLAEAYWATCPMTSWKMVLIGDPLYRPYAKNPQLPVDQLPLPLKAWLEKAAAIRPTGR